LALLCNRAGKWGVEREHNIDTVGSIVNVVT